MDMGVSSPRSATRQCSKRVRLSKFSLLPFGLVFAVPLLHCRQDRLAAGAERACPRCLRNHRRALSHCRNSPCSTRLAWPQARHGRPLSAASGSLMSAICDGGGSLARGRQPVERRRHDQRGALGESSDRRASLPRPTSPTASKMPPLNWMSSVPQPAMPRVRHAARTGSRDLAGRDLGGMYSPVAPVSRT